MSDLVEVKTIGEVERIVHGSGLWDGTGPVEFSDDGETWTQAWAPTPALVDSMPEITHPYFARVAVYRKDVRIPTTVTIRWDEQCPTGESVEWAEKWHRSPMRHFGRTARMVGFRQTFRDLLGNIVIEDEDRGASSSVASVVDDGPRNWGLEFATAQEVDELDAIVKEARAARIFKPTAEGTALDRAWKARRAVLEREDAEAWEPAPGPSEDAQGPATVERIASIAESIERHVPDLSPAERIHHDAFYRAEDEAAIAPNRPAPQDHLPGNRAQRRASKRKGRR